MRQVKAQWRPKNSGNPVAIDDQTIAKICIMNVNARETA